MINYSTGDLLSMHSLCRPLIQTSTAGECVAPLSNTILLQCLKKKKKKDVMDLKALKHLPRVQTKNKELHGVGLGNDIKRVERFSSIITSFMWARKQTKG